MAPATPIQDSESGEILNARVGEDQMVECVVVGSAYVRRENQDGTLAKTREERQDASLVRYRKGKRVTVDLLTLKNSKGVLSPTQELLSQLTAPDLTDVAGIGRTAAQRLITNGISNLEQLASASIPKIASAASITQQTAREWVEDAQLVMQEFEQEQAQHSLVIDALKGNPDPKNSNANISADLGDAEERMGQLPADVKVRKATAAGGDYEGTDVPMGNERTEPVARTPISDA